MKLITLFVSFTLFCFHVTSVGANPGLKSQSTTQSRKRQPQQMAKQSGKKQPEPLRQDSLKKLPTAQSSNWKVIVVKAAKYTEPRPNVDPPVSGTDHYNLLLNLELHYLGPDGNVPAPTVGVINETDKQYPAIGNMSGSGNVDFKVVTWLISSTHSEPDKRATKTGEKFGPHSFYIADIPVGSKQLKLIVADILPLEIKPTEPKGNGEMQ